MTGERDKVSSSGPIKILIPVTKWPVIEKVAIAMKLNGVIRLREEGQTYTTWEDDHLHDLEKPVRIVDEGMVQIALPRLDLTRFWETVNKSKPR